MTGVLFSGVRLDGRVHRSPKGAFVATEFFHLQFIPVVPQRSVLVIPRPGRGALLVALPSICWFSVLIAWLQTLLAFLAAAATLVVVVACFDPASRDAGTVAGFGLGGILALFGATVFGTRSTDRFLADFAKRRSITDEKVLGLLVPAAPKPRSGGPQSPAGA